MGPGEEHDGARAAARRWVAAAARRRPRAAGRPRGRRWLAAWLAVLGALALLIAGPLASRRPVVDADDWPPLVATVRVDPAAASVPLAPSFVGLSMEYFGFGHDAGVRPGATPDPLLARLVRGLESEGAPPLLRIGGRSSDASWWNPAHRRPPAGVNYVITPRWLARLRTLVDATGARVVLGLNLAIRRPAAAAAWARAAARALPPGALAGFEIGNEPDLYGHVAWYGVGVPHGAGARAAHAGRGAIVRRYARVADYGPRGFAREFLRYANAVRRALPGARFTGPGYSTPRWMPGLPAFLRTARRTLVAATFHRYPLRACFSPPVAPTIPHLLEAAASDGLAASVAPYVAQARARRLPFWISELNSVACGGRRGVSDTFASALWGMDTLLALAHAGVARAEVHTRPGSPYAPFALAERGGRWTARVAPLYAALHLFAQLAPPGTRVAPLHVTSRFRVVAWRLVDRRGRERVVLIDEDPAARGVVRILLGTRRTATLIRLDAPSLGARGGVRLAGRSYGADARLHGRRLVARARSDGDGYGVVLRRPGIAVLSVG
ncbi:MAG TPA: hypothetical protein VFU94_01205 [Conexibacter sp.]|nr:hypothetical protein [Conexibacter sp.]